MGGFPRQEQRGNGSEQSTGSLPVEADLCPAAVLTPPPRQRPYDEALRLGFDALRNDPPSSDRLALLGATQSEGTLRLPVLNREVLVNLDDRLVLLDDASTARCTGAVLTVHYLCATELEPDPRPVSFSYFQDCRSYLSVFGKRITARFLATSGRSDEQFAQLAEQFGGTREPCSGVGYHFDVFPRVPITLIRYEGDDEISPGASIVYRADAERLLPAEDRVVAAELLLDSFAGKPMSEWNEPLGIAGAETDTSGNNTRGTMVLVLIFLACFAIYYFANWKWLADVWEVR